MVDKSDEKAFPLREAHAVVRDLLKPDPRIYWIDFLFHIAVGWTAFISALMVPPFGFLQITAYLVAALAFYRAAIFTHELTHLKRGTFRLFRIVWNVLCGIPLLIPSFLYDGVHNDHHKRDVYGTYEDGEYIPFAVKQPVGMIGYVFLSPILPLFFVVRFLILAPLSWLFPPVRRFTWARASSLTIDLGYIRPVFAIRNDQHWRWQEFLAFVCVAGAVAAAIAGYLPKGALFLWYAIGVLIFFINSLRTLAAHAYRNPGDQPMSIAGQYLDSINVPGNKLTTALWTPVGLRFHALHHLFPNMPYHNLGKSHRKLTRELSDNRLYLETVRTSLWNALHRMWNEAAAR